MSLNSAACRQDESRSSDHSAIADGVEPVARLIVVVVAKLNPSRIFDLEAIPARSPAVHVVIEIWIAGPATPHRHVSVAVRWRIAGGAGLQRRRVLQAHQTCHQRDK